MLLPLWRIPELGEWVCASWLSWQQRSNSGTCRSSDTWGIWSENQRLETSCRCYTWPHVSLEEREDSIQLSTHIERLGIMTSQAWRAPSLRSKEGLSLANINILSVFPLFDLDHDCECKLSIEGNSNVNLLPNLGFGKKKKKKKKRRKKKVL